MVPPTPWFWTSSLQNHKRNTICYPKPLRLWSFVIAPSGGEYNFFLVNVVAGMGSKGRVSGDTQEGSSEELDLVDRVGVGVGEWEG